MWPRRPDAVEQMDDPGCDDATLERTYAAFRFVNPVVTGWRRTYQRWIRPRLSGTSARSLLDVGCGGGDVALALAGWARRDGLRLEVTGIDPDRRGITVARRSADARRSAGTAGHVRFIACAAHELAPASFDLVISNHVLHHVAELPGFLDETAAVCAPGGLVLHSDLRRSRVAYALFGAATLPLFRDTFIRADGLASITRSYTEPELRAAAPGWRVEAQRPFGLLLMRRPDA